MYYPRCCMCVERPYEFMGYCRRCFTATAADARAKGREPMEFAKELWENYNFLYGLRASPELEAKLHLRLALVPKKGERGFTIRPGVSVLPTLKLKGHCSKIQKTVQRRPSKPN